MRVLLRLQRRCHSSRVRVLLRLQRRCHSSRVCIFFLLELHRVPPFFFSKCSLKFFLGYFHVGRMCVTQVLEQLGVRGCCGLESNFKCYSFVFFMLQSYFECVALSGHVLAFLLQSLQLISYQLARPLLIFSVHGV